MDGLGRTKQEPESRAMQEQLPMDAVALLVSHALILIILNPNLIRPDLCRGSLIGMRKIDADPLDW